MKVKLLVIALSVLTLAGCINSVEVGPIELDKKLEGTNADTPKNLTPIDTIKINYQYNFEDKIYTLDFGQRGIIKGKQSPLIPLKVIDNDFEKLGFTYNISNNGQHALIFYKDHSINLQVGSNVFYMDEKPGFEFEDAPIFNNSSIYIPIIPLLEMLLIDYQLAGNELIIGERYTDVNNTNSTEGEIE